MEEGALRARERGRTRDAGSLVVRAERAFIDGALRPVTLTVVDGTIAAIDDGSDAPAPSGARVVAAPSGTVLLPGLVDAHVHVNEPGRTEWEGFRSATRAAAAAGITTIVDMPLNSLPPTTTVEALALKRRAAAPQAVVDVGFWGGAVPGNLGELRGLHEAGVYGFKAFLSPSGVAEFGSLDATGLETAMREIAALDSRIIVHAEDPAFLSEPGELGSGYDGFLRSRPARSERSAIATVVEAVRRTGARAHILHLADAGALPLLREAKAEGLPVTVETCPHYLTMVAEDIPDGAVEFKCCPPIRGRANRELLWQGVLDGTVDAIVSDHSPSTVERKRAGDGDFGLAWGGIAGLQLGLSATWTEARLRGMPLEALIPLFGAGPARVAGLVGRGEIRVGAPAHLSLFDPETEHVVDAHRLRHRNPISAYEGRALVGRTALTLLRGRVVFDLRDDREEAAGRLLSAREPADIGYL